MDNLTVSPGRVDSADLFIRCSVQRDIVLLRVEVDLVVGNLNTHHHLQLGVRPDTHLVLHDKLSLLVSPTPRVPVIIESESVTVIVHADVTGPESQGLTASGHSVQL